MAIRPPAELAGIWAALHASLPDLGHQPRADADTHKRRTQPDANPLSDTPATSVMDEDDAAPAEAEGAPSSAAPRRVRARTDAAPIAAAPGRSPLPTAATLAADCLDPNWVPPPGQGRRCGPAHG
jgi:hypothetical protein